jgi:hypothetical protein
MSHGKKPKRKKKKHPTGHKNPEGEKKLDDKPSHVNVGGKIEVDFPQDLVKKHETASSEEGRWKRKEFIVSIITAILIFLYTTVAAWQGCSNQKAANAAANGAAANVKQLEDFEAVQAARLIFEDFKVTIIPGKDFAVTGSIVVRNAGITVADDISFDCQSGAYNLEYNPNPTPSKGEQKPRPNLGGSSVASGQTKTYLIRTDIRIPFPPNFEITIPGVGKIRPEEDMIAKTEDVEAGRLRYSVNPSVSYNDVFGHPHIVTDCWTYASSSKTWISCPNLKQHQ